MRSPRREGGGNSGQEVAVVMAVAAVMAPVQRLQSKKKIRTKQQQQTQHSKQPKSATFSQLKSAPPPKKVHAPPVDFSKIAAAKKAAAKSSAKIEKPQTTVEIGIKEPEPPKLADDDLLPQGFEGAKWKALEDSMIRKERDVKSARCGSIQEGETCVQTGPWRAEPSGRVRMPIQGPQKVEGWVTVDTRRCRNAEGEWGNLSFVLSVEEDFEKQETDEPLREALQQQETSSSQTKTKPTASAKKASASARKAASEKKQQELDELLDLWGTDKQNDLSVGADPCPGSDDDDEDDEEDQNIQADSLGYSQDPAQASTDAGHSGASPSVGEGTGPAKPTNGHSQLSETERQLRGLRKKLRELEELEAKKRSSGGLTDLQETKLAKREELQQHEAHLLQQLKKEKRAAKQAEMIAKAEAAGEELPLKRKKKPTASERKAKQLAAKEASASKCRSLIQILAIVLPVGAAATAAIYWQ
eukprot:TRINITY_DN10659_c0_g1_i3.p1 TRINITY_DN10659_c0_g1~~TRINITY_DN10659_c0_g1_i3.p1  ORF type:complete len:472 (+),score=153.01 TRINITY_DN10659_c0_g1_i3:191-1606(+)